MSKKVFEAYNLIWVSTKARTYSLCLYRGMENKGLLMISQKQAEFKSNKNPGSLIVYVSSRNITDEIGFKIAKARSECFMKVRIRRISFHRINTRTHFDRQID